MLKREAMSRYNAKRGSRDGYDARNLQIRGRSEADFPLRVPRSINCVLLRVAESYDQPEQSDKIPETSVNLCDLVIYQNYQVLRPWRLHQETDSFLAKTSRNVPPKVIT